MSCPANILHLRSLAVSLARDACLTPEGENRALGDPTFDAVTQKRASFPGYSACGDLCHYVLATLFDYLSRPWPPWLNRDGSWPPGLPRDGSYPERDHRWRIGRNISALATESELFTYAFRAPKEQPEPGDILLLHRRLEPGREHVCILETWGDNGIVSTFDYGQKDASGTPHAANRRRKAEGSGAAARLGDRDFAGWLSLGRVFE